MFVAFRQNIFRPMLSKVSGNVLRDIVKIQRVGSLNLHVRKYNNRRHTHNPTDHSQILPITIELVNKEYSKQ